MSPTNRNLLIWKHSGYYSRYCMIEQRKHQRFDLKLPFQILRTDGGSGTLGETKNLSSSGVLFESASPLPIGDSIEYFITLPRTAGSNLDVRLRCVGRVVRHLDQEAFAATLDRYEFLREPAEKH